MTDEVRRKLSESSKRLWQDPKFRSKFSHFLASKKDSSVLERVANRIISEMGFAPHKLSHGGWTFDIAVELPGRKGVIIEVQGEFVHSLPKNVNRDVLKRNYFQSNLSDKYELKYLYENDFYAIGKIRKQLADWFSVVNERHEVSFADLVVRQDDAAFDFLSMYHYLSTKRGGIPVVAKLDDVVIAACVFSPPVRQECSKRLNLGLKELLELSRFCIDSKYQVKNLGSWFLSRAIGYVKELVPSVKAIITWADTTMGHDGTLYKATGFTYDGSVPATYWYVDQTGHWFHKKSIWNQASRNKCSEASWVEKHNLIKIRGSKLLRFIKRL
jgi:GNAT superfamily N-acetyltransferase